MWKLPFLSRWKRHGDVANVHSGELSPLHCGQSDDALSATRRHWRRTLNWEVDPSRVRPSGPWKSWMHLLRQTPPVAPEVSGASQTLDTVPRGACGLSVQDSWLPQASVCSRCQQHCQFVCIRHEASDLLLLIRHAASVKNSGIREYAMNFKFDFVQHFPTSVRISTKSSGF